MLEICNTCVDLIQDFNFNQPGNLFDRLFDVIPVNSITTEEIAPAIGFYYPVEFIDVLIADI